MAKIGGDDDRRRMDKHHSDEDGAGKSIVQEKQGLESKSFS